MRLCEDGTVDLNADISNYLGFKVRNPRHPESVITLKINNIVNNIFFI